MLYLNGHQKGLFNKKINLTVSLRVRENGRLLRPKNAIFRQKIAENGKDKISLGKPPMSENRGEKNKKKL